MNGAAGRGRQRRRAVCLAALTVLVGGCLPGRAAAPTMIAPIALPTAAASPVPGRLLIARDGNLLLLDLATRAETPLTHFPRGAFAAAPAVSPDRRRIAYTYYVVPSNPKDLGGSDLAVMGADGGDPHVIWAHGEPGTSFEEPCWAADGQAILATRRAARYVNGSYQGETTSIVRVSADGARLTTLVADGQSPAASPDGRWLVYATANAQGATDRLWIADAAGRSPRELLAGQGFTLVRAPRFSPDSQRIAFAAVGGPVRPAAVVPSGPFAPAVALAHGIPWEVWTVRVDGGDLRRLTHVQEDSPTPAWSPDGTWIAFTGEIGIYLVNAAGTTTLRLSTRVSGGGIAWL